MKYCFLNKRVVAIMLLLAVVSACSIPKRSQQIPQVIPPEHFAGAGTDTISIANRPWKQFFNDAALVTLIDTALQNNIDLQRTLQRIAMTRAQLRMDNAALFPTVGVALSGSFDHYGKYTLNGVGNFDTNLSPNIDKDQQIPAGLTPDIFAGLRSSWEADIWGRLKAKKRGAYLRYLASEKGRQWITTQVVSQVAALYYTLLALDQEKQIIEQNIVLQEKAVDVVKAQKAGGRATELAVQQFEAQLYDTRAAIALVDQRILLSENALNRLMGRYPQPIKRNKNAALLPGDAPAGKPLQMMTRRPDIVQAELELAASGADVETARKAFLPSWNITAYAALNTFKASLLLYPSSIAYGFMGGLAAPIINRQQLKSQYAMVTAAQADAFYQYRQTVLNAFGEISTNLQGMHHYKAAYMLKQKETATLQTAVNTAHELYASGYASYLEVITAQKGVLDASLGTVQQQQQVYLSWIDLYRSLGGGWD